jgi:hypothetical protein
VVGIAVEKGADRLTLACGGVGRACAGGTSGGTVYAAAHEIGKVLLWVAIGGAQGGDVQIAMYVHLRETTYAAGEDTRGPRVYLRVQPGVGVSDAGEVRDEGAVEDILVVEQGLHGEHIVGQIPMRGFRIA